MKNSMAKCFLQTQLALCLILFSYSGFSQCLDDWAISLTSDSMQLTYKLQIDDENYIYAASVFKDTCTIVDSNDSTFQIINPYGEYSLLITKHDENGVFIWGTPIHSSFIMSSSPGLSLHDNTLYVTGSYGGMLLYEGEVIENTNPGFEFFIGGIDLDGSMLWIENFASSDQVVSSCIDVDNNGNIVVSGYYTGNLSLDGTTLVASNPFVDVKREMFIAKFSNTGNLMWAKTTLGTPLAADHFIRPFAIKCDNDDDILVGGFFNHDLKLEGLTINSSNLGSASFRPFVAKFNGENGQALWTGSGKESQITFSSVYDIGIDANDNVFITGTFDQNLYFTNALLHPRGSNDIFLIKYDKDGNRKFAKRFGASNNNTPIEAGTAIAISENNTVIVAGKFGDKVMIEDWPFYTDNENRSDFGVVEFTLSGGFVGFDFYGGKDDEIAFDATFDNYGDLVAAGFTNSVISHFGTDSLDVNVEDSNSFLFKICGYELPTAANENFINQIKIYPNPAQELLYIEAGEEAKWSSFSKYKIANVFGQILKQESLYSWSNLEQHPINISDLSPGVYHLILEMDKGSVSQKFLVQ